MAYQTNNRKGRALQAKARLRHGGDNKAAVARINAAMTASALPAPRKQPTAGQLVGAKIITTQ
jgi:hypothetical protein